MYAIGNQVFNLITYLPTIIGPLIITKLAAATGDDSARQRICERSFALYFAIAVTACITIYFGLKIGVRFLPARYASAIEIGVIASLAAAFQVIRAPFSLYFLSKLQASRDMVSSFVGAIFIIVATTSISQIGPELGTELRALAAALQAAIMAGLYIADGPIRKLEARWFNGLRKA